MHEGWAQGLVGVVLRGRYRLDGLIGMGGMGAVFAGTHLSLDRPVAVKVLLRDLTVEPTLTQRFFAEARAAASVDQVGVVDVIDLDVDPDHGPFLVMERLRGESLAAVLTRGPLPVDRAVSIIADVLDVLAAVHAKGIVHRDLKPPNVFLHRTDDGAELVKVVDFGIARISQARLTITGQVIGTPRWMSPEQARGDEIDARADIYAAGLLLRSAITGRVPFPDVHAVDIAQALAEGPAPLRDELPGLPEPLYGILERALASDPAQRFGTAAEMAQALRTMAAGAPTMAASPAIVATAAAPAAPAAPVAPVAGSLVHRRWPLHLALAIVLLLGVLSVALMWPRPPNTTANDGRTAVSVGVALRADGPCAVPLQGPWAVRAGPDVLVWSSPSGSLVVRSGGTRGSAPASSPGLLIMSGDAMAFTNTGDGTVNLRVFDPDQSRGDVSFTAVRLQSPDGRSCTLNGTVRAGL